MSSGSKKKGPRYAFSFSLKSPGTRTPPASPTGPLWRELPINKAFLQLSQIPHKIPEIKTFIPSLKGPRKGASLHVPQKRGPNGNRCPFPEPYLAYLSGSPLKEPSFQFPLIELPRRDTPHS